MRATPGPGPGAPAGGAPCSRSRRPPPLTAALLLAAVAVGPARGEPLTTAPPPSTDGPARWLEDGVTRLAAMGITPSLDYTADVLGNPVGGLRQGAAYAATLHGALDADLGALAGLPHWHLVVAGAWTQGSNLSVDAIGNIFWVAEAFNGSTFRLAQTYLAFAPPAGRWQLAAGRLAVGDDFAALPSYQYYVNSAVNGNPASILIDLPSFTTPPFSQWGARARFAPHPDLYVSSGIYNSDPGVQADREHGLDFTFNPGEGVLGLVEAGYAPAGGVAGRAAIGGYYDSSAFDFVDGSNRSVGRNYGLYALAERVLHREAGDPGEGLTAWGTLTIAPDARINTLPLALYAGARYRGLFARRPADVTAAAVAFGAFSRTLPDQDFELVLELNHRFQLTGHSYLTPNLQYVVNPDGRRSTPDAAVIGFEFSASF